LHYLFFEYNNKLEGMIFLIRILGKIRDFAFWNRKLLK